MVVEGEHYVSGYLILPTLLYGNYINDAIKKYEIYDDGDNITKIVAYRNNGHKYLGFRFYVDEGGYYELLLLYNEAEKNKGIGFDYWLNGEHTEYFRIYQS